VSSIYSRRFLLSAAGVNSQYQVPAGQLAVVRTLVVFNGSTAAAGSYVFEIGPGPTAVISAYLVPLSATSTDHQQQFDLHLAVNALEYITLLVGSGVSGAAAGFLFSS
jgi:hypothetical protein